MSRPAAVKTLTRSWGSWPEASLYLDRCQVDTPAAVVDRVWEQVLARRPSVSLVVDFGAGDGRFARAGRFDRYIGYEIDMARSTGVQLPANAELRNQCAFDHGDPTADVAIGNPPYVRNQDLPAGWRLKAARVVQSLTEVRLSGLANAWQYFLMLSLASVHDRGLVALVLPYEWVSRPAARPIRDYLVAQGWAVDVYQLPDDTFGSVATSACITVIDKATTRNAWRYHHEGTTLDGGSSSPSAGAEGVLAYTSRRREPTAAHARRGLSPGTQRALVLTEAERLRAGLLLGDDVVSCLTSLRGIPRDRTILDTATFRELVRDQGARCYLIRTDTDPSEQLQRYLDSVDEAEYQTSTCLSRERWWLFNMPPVPQFLFSQSFKNAPRPKLITNTVKARAVGGVAGIYELPRALHDQFVRHWQSLDLRPAVVPYSGGMYKVEINQVNTILDNFLRQHGGAGR